MAAGRPDGIAAGQCSNGRSPTISNARRSAGATSRRILDAGRGRPGFREEGMNMRSKRFEIDRDNGKLLGVCAGLANHTGIDATSSGSAWCWSRVIGAFPWTLIAYGIAYFAGKQPRRQAGCALRPLGHPRGSARADPQPRPQDAGDRDLCDQLEQPPRPRDRGSALAITTTSSVQGGRDERPNDDDHHGKLQPGRPQHRHLRRAQGLAGLARGQAAGAQPAAPAATRAARPAT